MNEEENIRPDFSIFNIAGLVVGIMVTAVFFYIVAGFVLSCHSSPGPITPMPVAADCIANREILSLVCIVDAGSSTTDDCKAAVRAANNCVDGGK